MDHISCNRLEVAFRNRRKFAATKAGKCSAFVNQGPFESAPIKHLKEFRVVF